MVKAIKIPLISKTVDQEGNEIDFHAVSTVLWQLQRETRELKNKAVQLLWEWYNFSSDYKKAYGEYPPKDACGCAGGIASYLYSQLKDVTHINSADVSSILQGTQQVFQKNIKEYLRGDKSIASYKQNQPVDLHKNAIKLYKSGDEYSVSLSLLSKKGAESLRIKKITRKDGSGATGYAIAETGEEALPIIFPSRFDFRCTVRDKSTRTILDRCLAGTYTPCGSKLTYNDKKKVWTLLLSFSFESETLELDKEKILGVDLGFLKPFMASVFGDKNRIFAEGGDNSEVEVFRRRIEARRISMLKQSKMCGDGRIGHGRSTRIQPIEKLESKIANFRSTMNHKYSRAIVDFAKKNNCGIIQMEDLTGIKVVAHDKIVREADEDATARTTKMPKYLANWSYYDLQEKVKVKAAAEGIKVVFVNPQYTTLRCPKCGKIHPENNPTQAKFKCHYCEFEENADYVASQNLALPGIAGIIKDELVPSNVPGVKTKKTRKKTEV